VENQLKELNECKTPYVADNTELIKSLNDILRKIENYRRK
jgi:hypothetical protein